MPKTPNEIRLKDGIILTVHAPQAGRVILTAPADALGLTPYRLRAPAAAGLALYAGMPVEAVRSLCREHGGVAHAGEEAVALLKTLGSAPTDSPAPAPAAPAEEPVPASPLPSARGPTLAGGAAPEAAPGALDDDPENPFIVLDDLTDAVISARRAVRDFEGPVEWKWGKLPSDKLPYEEALWRRATRGHGLGSRLAMAEHDRFARHPLRAEALRLRESLLATAEDALLQQRERREGELRRQWKINGVRSPAPAG